MIEKLTWLGHATFKIKGEKCVIYIDPWKLKGGEEPADIILVGHSHYDHLSVSDIEKISKPSTTIVTVPDCTHKLKGNIKVVKPGDTLTVGDVEIEAVPAYNINKTFHPRVNNWVGFIITVEGERLYYASDTDVTPEMNNIKDIDVALFPVGGTYTMDGKEAAKAADIIKPKIAVPYHYGDIVGNEEDARVLKSNYAGETRIMTPAR